MAQLALDRKKAAARERALLQQAERVARAVPSGLALAPVEPQSVPYGRHRHEALAALFGVPELVGMVVQCPAYSTFSQQGPRMSPTWGNRQAWVPSVVWLGEGSRLEVSTHRRVATFMAWALVKEHGSQPAAQPDLAVPLPMPGTLTGSFDLSTINPTIGQPHED